MEDYQRSELLFYSRNIDIEVDVRDVTKDLSFLSVLGVNSGEFSKEEPSNIKKVRIIDNYIDLNKDCLYLVFLNDLSEEKVNKIVDSGVEYYFVLNEKDLLNKVITIGKNRYEEVEGERYRSFYEENKNSLEHNIGELKETIEKGTYNLTLDKDFVIIDMNKKFMGIFDNGLNCIGEVFFELIHKNEPTILKEEIREKITSGGVWEGRVNLINNQNKSIFTIMTVIPITNNNSEITGYRILINEITELIKFLSYLEDENEMFQNQNTETSKILFRNKKQAAMGELISMIAHQWRQPLSTINLMVSDLTLKSTLGDYDERYYLDVFKKIEGHIEYMSITIDDFRNFFKPNKSKEVFSLSSVMKNAQTIMGDTFDKNDIYFHSKINESVILNTYKSELLQVVLNLMKNAKDVIKERDIRNGYLSVKTRMRENGVVISFEDNGGGIPEEIIDKIFEPYFSTKDEKNGTGLGLSMSKTIIEEHMGGRISVYNTKYGTNFEVKLPIHKQD